MNWDDAFRLWDEYKLSTLPERMDKPAKAEAPKARVKHILEKIPELKEKQPTDITPTMFHEAVNNYRKRNRITWYDLERDRAYIEFLRCPVFPFHIRLHVLRKGL